MVRKAVGPIRYSFSLSGGRSKISIWQFLGLWVLADWFIDTINYY
jgi:hypothetical protein